jgi:hypothetical protein
MFQHVEVCVFQVLTNVYGSYMFARRTCIRLRCPYLRSVAR